MQAKANKERESERARGVSGGVLEASGALRGLVKGALLSELLVLLLLQQELRVRRVVWLLQLLRLLVLTCGREFVGMHVLLLVLRVSLVEVCSIGLLSGATEGRLLRL
jgi:hypothetical protein